MKMNRSERIENRLSGQAGERGHPLGLGATRKKALCANFFELVEGGQWARSDCHPNRLPMGPAPW
jgi:hypothetical protein